LRWKTSLGPGIQALNLDEHRLSVDEGPGLDDAVLEALRESDRSVLELVVGSEDLALGCRRLRVFDMHVLIRARQSVVVAVRLEAAVGVQIEG
jgi:hypothetical protein